MSAVFRRPGANAKRAELAAERKAYEASFSYEDDIKKSPALAPPAVAQAPGRDKQSQQRR